MKITFKTLLLILSISLVNCKKDEKLPPEILSQEITEITATSAVLNLELDGYWDGLSAGIFWSTDPAKLRSGTDNFLLASPGKKIFLEMKELTPNTKYYVIAFVYAKYAIKKEAGKTNYGEMIEFTTLAE